VPTALKDIGMPADGIDRALAAALGNPYWNPAAPRALFVGVRGTF
jgi:hypothetical protein